MSADVHGSLEDAVTQARTAEKAEHHDAALAAWSLVLERSPANPQAYVGAANALSKTGRSGEAAAVLLRGMEHCPQAERIAAEFAWLAHHAADWPEADRRWTDLRKAFPGCLSGYVAGSAALKALGRSEQAEAVLAEGLSRWPNALGLLLDFAASADARGDTAEAARRWATLRRLHPDEPLGFLREARALRSAGDLLGAEERLLEGSERFPSNPKLLIEYAQLAQERGLSAQALTRWDVVVTAFPWLVDGYVGAARALNDLGRCADAQNVLQPALRMFPESEDLAGLDAWAAHYMGDFASATERWASMRARFPAQVTGYVGGVASLLANSKPSEASELIEQARQRFPGNLQIAVEYARFPQKGGDWQEAFSRWTSVRARFPNAVPVLSGYAQALAKLDRWEESQPVFETAIASSKGDVGPLRTYADCAAQRGDWARAEAAWRRLTERFPEKTAGWNGLAETLRETGRAQEAETLLKEATRRFPDNVDLGRQLAVIATLRRDWPVALRLWEELKRKHPRHQGVLGGITEALWQAQQDWGVARSEGGSAPFTIPASLLTVHETADDEQARLQKLFMAFETIGDTCEFGIVQRRFGAEPISLLRWTSTPPEHLVTALDTRFAGVGDPEHTVVAVIHGEYTTRDRRYHMFSHTFTPEKAEPVDVFTTQQLRRMQYLRRKLLDDLADGDKIFVYKCLQGLSNEQARAIHRAIAKYGGDHALLCVRLEEPHHARGTVELLDDGLFMGYTDRFSTIDINVDIWVSLCQQVSSLWKARCAARPAA